MPYFNPEVAALSKPGIRVVDHMGSIGTGKRQHAASKLQERNPNCPGKMGGRDNELIALTLAHLGASRKAFKAIAREMCVSAETIAAHVARLVESGSLPDKYKLAPMRTKEIRGPIEEKFKVLALEGLGTPEISRRLGISETAVKRMRLKFFAGQHLVKNVVRSKPMLDKHRTEIMKMFGEGMSFAKIAHRFGVCAETVGKWRKALGLPSRQFGINGVKLG